MEKLIESLDDHTLLTLLTISKIKDDSTIKSLCESLPTFTPSTQSLKDRLTTLNSKVSSFVDTLKSKVTSSSSSITTSSPSQKKITIYVEGVFDIIHSGHFNAIRQAKKLGDILCVGVNSDADVARAKGPTLMPCNERTELAKACKWADSVVPDTPYTPSVKLLDDLKVDFCAHGDDIPYNENGECVYDEIMKANRMKWFKRTEGVSTTEIIGRLLMCICDDKEKMNSTALTKEEKENLKQLEEFSKNRKPVMSSFLATSWRISEFSNAKVPKEGDKIIYIDGDFDILHIGHIQALKAAKSLGNFVYVGVHDDDTVRKHKGKNFPILNLNERVFNLLALKYVDEVIIGAPYKITEDMVKSLKIDVVVEGIKKGGISIYDDAYEIPKKMGIYKSIELEYDLSNQMLIDRIYNNRDIYIKKFLNKAKKDQEYLENKTGKDEVKEI